MKNSLKIFGFTFFCVLLIVVYFTTAKFSFANEDANQEEVQVDTTFAQEISKYIELEDVTILEQKINIGLVNEEGNSREAEIISALVPDVHSNQPQDWYVVLNGKKLESEEYVYNAERHILIITNEQNDEQAEKEEWQNGENEYEIVYIYQNAEENQEQNQEQVQEITLRTATSTKLYEQDAIIKVDEKQEVLEAKGNLAEMEQTIEGEFYKGYLYANLDREIELQEKNKVKMLKADLLENILIQDGGTVVTGNEGQIYNFNANITYKRTAISKSDVERILGEEGKIVIKDENGNELASIDGKTEANEDGNIYVEYMGKVHLLQLEIINPQTEGNLWITHTKSVKQQTNGEKEILQALVNMSHRNNVVTNYGTNETQGNIELKDTTIQTNLQVNKESLSTSASNDLEIQLTLCSNNAKYDLYENPVIEITLPDEVENIEVNSVDLLYEQELHVKNVLVNEKTIRIEVEGSQTDYKSGSIEGAVVSVKAKVDLNKLSVNATKEIVTKVENNGKIAETKKQIEITSPRDIITVNNISNLGVETLGEEETVATEVAKGEESKNLTVESQIINNNGENIENVTILGDFGTNGAVTLEDRMLENNLGVSVIAPVTVEGAEAKVYYTQNFTATNDLQNSENGWTESTDGIGTASKYLVVIDGMEKDASVNLSYEINVPENLDYNMQAYEGYSVNYKTTSTASENSAVSTYVELTTGVGAEIETTITGSVGGDILQNGDLVKQGEIIRYVMQITNTGTEDASNITLTGAVPEGTVAVVIDGTLIDNVGVCYEEVRNTEYVFNIESLAVGESVAQSFEVRVKDDTAEGSSISNKAVVSYGDVIEESETLTNEVETGKVRVSVKSTTVLESDIIQNDIIQYIAIIENLTDEDIEGYTLEWNISGGYTILDNSIDEPSGIGEYNANSTLELGTIPANRSTLVVMLANADQLDGENNFVAEITANVIGDKTYRSNLWEEHILTNSNISLEVSATDEGEYLNSGDNITYTITAINESDIATTIYLEDEISTYLSILGVRVNGETLDLDNMNATQENTESFTTVERNKLRAQRNVEPGESFVIEIDTVINANENLNEVVTITNQANATVAYTEKQSNIVTHYIEYKSENQGGNDNTGENNNDTYYLSGKAWLDENQDGKMQENETGLSNIRVYLQDVSSGELVKNSNGESKVATTGRNGEYSFSNLEGKNYIVIFDYDSSRYRLTTYQKEGVESSKNSKAINKRVTLENYEKTYGVTDEINLTNGSVGNINIGLIEADTFDLALTKTVQRVTVQTPTKTNVYSFGNVNLAKVELSRKDSENVTITIQYSITVTNNGEIVGYAKEIIDYLPEEFKVSNESNQIWRTEGDTIVSTALTNEAINPGESKTITLVVTREAQEEATGTYSNTAEIAQIYNEQGIDDINSVPGNRVSSENDIDTAEVIVSIGTGRAIWYITLITSVVIIIGIGVYLIKIKVLGKEESNIEK